MNPTIIGFTVNETERIIQEYEEIRLTGETNMFDYNKVIELANEYECWELASLSQEEYVKLLSGHDRFSEAYL